MSRVYWRYRMDEDRPATFCEDCLVDVWEDEWEEHADAYHR